MSSLYITEPPTQGKVMLQTTKGDIELELWSKECPLACRNFIQLCLEGYFLETSFHRIVPGFCIQAGDPSGTGTGGQSIWDSPFKDEFHARLKYNRRGLLGMANTGTVNDNGSQFFITLAATPELQEKNTLFGRVVGDTIYNVDRIGKSELESEAGSDRPRYPTRITGAEVLVNPFTDIEPRTTPALLKEQQAALLKRKPKAKFIGKNKKMLSFADEEEETGLVLAPKAAKMMMRRPSIEQETTTVTTAKTIAPPTDIRATPPPVIAKPTPAVDPVQAQIAALEASLRKRKRPAAPPVEVVATPQSALEQARGAYTTKARVGGRKARARLGEEETLVRLSTFQNRLATAKTEAVMTTPKQEQPCALHGVPGCASCRVTEAADDDDDAADFMSHQLVFEADHRGKDLAFRQRAEDELELIDPREKAGRLALEAREAKRRRNEATGRNIFGGKAM